jgi:hypothetical protein
MKNTLTLAAAILCAAIPMSALSQAQDDPNRPARSGSLKQDIKNDARAAKQEIKGEARETKAKVKRGAHKTKRSLAVAECNDGRYSYTRHKTCNKHGGVKTQLR